MAFTDTFTNSNGTALATHNANWTVHQGTGEIQSNSLKLYNTSAISWATYAGTFNDDQYSQAVASAISSGHFNGLVVRCNTGGTATFYGTSWDGSNAYIFKQVSGSYTQLGAAVTSPTAGVTVKLAVSGTTISLYHDGSLVTTRTDSDITSGNPGVFAYHESASRLDTWEGGQFARAQISWAEFEVPVPTARAQISWAEFEVPNTTARAQVSWAELEVPDYTLRRAQVSWAELEVPLAPARAMVSWAELEVPDVGGSTERRRLIGYRWFRNQ